jgi:MFS transporter, AAHS family, 4-hydroxybenzoate transporter
MASPSGSIIDAGELLDCGSWSAWQKLFTALAALAIVFDGFDIQVLGFAIPDMARQWRVSSSPFGAVLAIGLAGMIVGGPLAGWCGDRFGRRSALIGCVAVFGLATLGTVFIRGLTGLAILRFISGMGTGGALPNAGALAAEFAPKRWRAAAVKLTLVCVPIGGMLAGFLAARLLPRFGWRGLYSVGGALPLLIAIVFQAALPESPRFLARVPASWPELARLLNRIGHAVPANAQFEDRSEPEGAKRASLSALFAPGLARDTAGLWLAFLFCLGSIYLVFGWLPALLTARGLDLGTASSGLAVYNLGGVLGVLLWALLVTAFGSRGPMLSAALACAASAWALLLTPIHADGSHVLPMVCLGIDGLLANAVQVSLYALAAHIYPTSIRATGVAYAGTIGRAGGLLSSLFGATVIQGGAGAYWNTLAISMIVAFAGLTLVRNHIPAVRTWRHRQRSRIPLVRLMAKRIRRVPGRSAEI